MILNYIRRCEKNMMISTIVTLLLGLVLTFEPAGSIKVITYIVAGLFILIGLLQLIEYLRQNKIEKVMSLSFVLGIVLCAIGTYLILNINALVNVVTVIIGFVIILKSLFKIQFALNVRHYSIKWTYNLIVGIASLVLGIVVLINPFESAELFLRIIGILLVLGSIVDLVETFIVLKTLDDAKEDALELPFEEKK